MREACYGKCPEYVLELFTDGRVQFTGIAHIKPIGVFETYVDKSKLVELLSLAESIRFFDLADQYPASWQAEMSEFPVMTHFIQYQGQRHTIRNRHDSPDGLVRFEQFIEEHFLLLDWKAIDKDE